MDSGPRLLVCALLSSSFRPIGRLTSLSSNSPGTARGLPFVVSCWSPSPAAFSRERHRHALFLTTCVHRLRALGVGRSRRGHLIPLEGTCPPWMPKYFFLILEIKKQLSGPGVGHVEFPGAQSSGVRTCSFISGTSPRSITRESPPSSRPLCLLPAPSARGPPVALLTATPPRPALISGLLEFSRAIPPPGVLIPASALVLADPNSFISSHNAVIFVFYFHSSEISLLISFYCFINVSSSFSFNEFMFLFSSFLWHQTFAGDVFVFFHIIFLFLKYFFSVSFLWKA